MVVCGLLALSLAVTGGSALVKNRRPSSSTTLAIWALAPRAKNVAWDASNPRRSPAVYAARVRIMPLGKAHNNLGSNRIAVSFRHCPEAVNVTSVLETLPSSHPCGRPPSHGSSYKSVRANVWLPPDTVLALPATRGRT